MYLWRRATAPPLSEALARLRGGVVAVVGGHGAGPKQLGGSPSYIPRVVQAQDCWPSGWLTRGGRSAAAQPRYVVM